MMQHKVKNDTAVATRKTTPNKMPDQFLFPFPIGISWLSKTNRGGFLNIIQCTWPFFTSSPPGILQTSSGPSLTSLIFLCHGKMHTDKQQVKVPWGLFYYVCLSLSSFNLLNQLEKILPYLLSCLWLLQVCRKSISVSFGEWQGRRCETANVSHYTHNNWPKTPLRLLLPYAVTPFLPLFISLPLLLSDSSEAGLDLQPRQP